MTGKILYGLKVLLYGQRPITLLPWLLVIYGVGWFIKCQITRTNLGNDFQHSALKFELFFWTNNIFQVEFINSDLRFRIDKIFREEEVTIPFPQRDVHNRNQS